MCCKLYSHEKTITLVCSCVTRERLQKSEADTALDSGQKEKPRSTVHYLASLQRHRTDGHGIGFGEHPSQRTDRDERKKNRLLVTGRSKV